MSEPFSAGDHNRGAVKVIDDTGNELMLVKDLEEGRDRAVIWNGGG